VCRDGPTQAGAEKPLLNAVTSCHGVGVNATTRLLGPSCYGEVHAPRSVDEGVDTAITFGRENKTSAKVRARCRRLGQPLPELTSRGTS